MFSTKIRTIIIGLVASTGFAVAAAVPAASQAQWHNYCIAGHCTTHANYTINDPCTSGTAAAASTTEAQKAEEEQKKKEEEEKEGQVHQGEIEKSFYGCDAETPPTSGGSSRGTSTGRSAMSGRPPRAEHEARAAESASLPSAHFGSRHIRHSGGPSAA